MKIIALCLVVALWVNPAASFCCKKPGAPANPCGSVSCADYDFSGVAGADVIGRCNEVFQGQCCQYQVSACDIRDTVDGCTSPDNCGDVGNCVSNTDSTTCRKIVPVRPPPPPCQRVTNYINIDPPQPDCKSSGPVDFGGCCGDCCRHPQSAYDRVVYGKVNGNSRFLMYFNSNTAFFNGDGNPQTFESIRFEQNCGQNVLGVMIRGLANTRAGFIGFFTYPDLNSGANWRCTLVPATGVPVGWMNWGFDDSSWIYNIVPDVIPFGGSWIWGDANNALSSNQVALCRIRWTWNPQCLPSRYGLTGAFFDCPDGTSYIYDVYTVKRCNCKGKVVVYNPPVCPRTTSPRLCLSSTCTSGQRCKFDDASQRCFCP